MRLGRIAEVRRCSSTPWRASSRAPGSSSRPPPPCPPGSPRAPASSRRAPRTGRAALADFVVRAGVVVAVRQSQPALQRRGDDLRRVLAVFFRAEGEKRVDAQRLEAADLRAQARAGRGSRRSSRAPGSIGVEALRLDRRLVHAGAVEVAELSLVGALRRRLVGRQPVEDLAQVVLVALPQLVETSPSAAGLRGSGSSTARCRCRTDKNPCRPAPRCPCRPRRVSAAGPRPARRAPRPAPSTPSLPLPRLPGSRAPQRPPRPLSLPSEFSSRSRRSSRGPERTRRRASYERRAQEFDSEDGGGVPGGSNGAISGPNGTDVRRAAA